MTPDAVDVGLVYPDSGPLASTFSAVRSGVNARLGVTNDNGGVHGRQVEFDWRDDANLPGANLAAVKELASSDVFAVMELSLATGGSADYLHERGIPAFGAGIHPVWSSYENMFSWATLFSASSHPTAWGEFVYEHGGRRAVVIGPRDPAGGIGAEMSARSMRAGGVEVVGRIDFADSGFDTASVLRQIVEAGADTITGQLLISQLAPLMELARQQGRTLTVLAPSSLYDSSVLAAYGALLDGVYVYTDTLPFEVRSDAHREFLAAMAKYSPEAQPAAQSSAVYGWIIADMLVAGLEVVGDCPDRATLIENLRATRGYTAGGFLPAPINFSDYGQVAPCYSFIRISASAFTVEDPVNRCGSVGTTPPSPPA